MQIDQETKYCLYHEETGKLKFKELSLDELQVEIERIKQIPCTCLLTEQPAPEKPNNPTSYFWGE